MNDPLTKYAGLNTAKDLVFFNYHEYLVSEYTPITSPTNDQSAIKDGYVNTNTNNSPSLVINHFPNPYTARDGDLFWKTRIIRIPRIYDQTEELYMVPQFSTHIPGHEPAALSKENIVEFQEAGIYRGYSYGITSHTPLVPQWLSEDEYRDIVKTINTLLYEATTPQNSATWLDSALDFFTGTLYTTFFSKFIRDSKFVRDLKKVEAYVEEVNARLRQKHEDLQIISLLKSAMLSLDIQIPMKPTDIETCEARRDHYQRPSQSTVSGDGEQDKESSVNE